MNIALAVSFVFLVSSLFLSFVRVVRGPSLPDRVLAIDLSVMCMAGVIVGAAIATRQPVLLDAIIVLTQIFFLGTIAFALYLERNHPND